MAFSPPPETQLPTALSGPGGASRGQQPEQTTAADQQQPPTVAASHGVAAARLGSDRTAGWELRMTERAHPDGPPLLGTLPSAATSTSTARTAVHSACPTPAIYAAYVLSAGKSADNGAPMAWVTELHRSQEAGRATVPGLLMRERALHAALHQHLCFPGPPPPAPQRVRGVRAHGTL